MGSILRRRDGMALMVAIVSLVIIGVLVAGVLFVSTQEYRVGRNSLVQQRALTAAEYGQNQFLTDWTAAALNLANGDTLQREYPAIGNGASASVRITRLNAGTFWIVSEGRAGTGNLLETRRRTGSILRIDIPTVNVTGALTTKIGNRITISGSAALNGNDVNPAGWDCPGAGPSVAGLAAQDTTSTNFTFSSSTPIAGSPPVLETPVASDTNTYKSFGGWTYDSLKAMATKIYPAGYNASTIAPSTVGANCNTADAKNWGEPLWPPSANVAACHNYFPIMWVQGNLAFSSGRGQGILLIDGDLNASGGTQFNGLVITKGKLTTSGGGIKIYGAVLVANPNPAANIDISGSSGVQFSRCALNNVLSRAIPRPRLSPQRAWADMY